MASRCRWESPCWTPPEESPKRLHITMAFSNAFSNCSRTISSVQIARTSIMQKVITYLTLSRKTRRATSPTSKSSHLTTSRVCFLDPNLHGRCCSCIQMALEAYTLIIIIIKNRVLLCPRWTVIRNSPSPSSDPPP